MKMVQPKLDSEIKLDGVKAEITRDGSNVIRVSLRDTSGNVLEIGLGRYSDIQVLIPAPPEKKQVWVIMGEVAGIKINENFDSEYSAKTRREELISKLNLDENGLAIQKSEILEVA